MNDQFPERDSTLSGVEEAARRAIDAALNFLSYRQRTDQEVRRKLVSRGFSPEIVEAALGRLRDVGLVDDEAFVAAYVRDRIAHRPLGLRRMLQELYLKGVSRELAISTIEHVLADEDTDEWSLARRVVEKKRRTLAAREFDEAVERRRLRDHLIRRGFAVRIARDAVDELFSNGDAGRKTSAP